MLDFDTKRPDSATLYLHVKGLFLLAYKNNTHSVYDRAWSIFDNYCMFYDKGILSTPGNGHGGVCGFYVSRWISSNNNHHLHIGVKHHLQFQGARDFNDSFLLKLILKGAAASPHEPDVRLPITLPVLDRMFHALPLVHDNQFEVCMYSTLLTVGFCGLFCLGELAMSEHVILAENVHIGTNKAMPTYKANCTCTAQHITINSHSTACPIKALTAYALIHPKRPGQFFIHLSDNPVLTQDIACILNKLSTFLNLP